MKRGMRVVAVGFVWFCLSFGGAAVAAPSPDAPLLHAIRFNGNEVTRESVMRQEMSVHEGEPYSVEMIERSRQSIMNLGLFKSVKTELLQEEGKHILVVTVEERFYVLPLPLVDYRPGFLADEKASNYSYGGEIRFDNLFGLNQRLKISYEEKHYVDEVEPPVKELEIDYAYPRIVGTPYSLEVDLSLKRKSLQRYDGETLIASATQNSRSGTVFVSRWLNASGASEGWRAGGGINAATNRYSEIEGEALFRDGQTISLLANLGYLRIDRYAYHRDGHEFNYDMSIARPAWSSDSDFFRNTFAYRRYLPLQGVDANLNTQLKLGLSFGDGDAYSLGSSTSLRGYESDTVQGDVLLQGNVEYHHHLSGYRQLRGVVFIDAGNVWPSADNIDSARLYTSTGVGARWRVQSFVDVTLRLDYAYNMETGGTETYFATSGSF